MFIGRRKELETLEKAYSNGSFQFVAIYGRRRVGKTTLINEFCKGRKCVSFLATKESLEILLREFSQVMHQTICPGAPLPVFQDFSSLFAFYDQKLDDGLVIVIDEFPYLAESDPSIASVLQKFIDSRLRPFHLESMNF